MRRLFNWLLPIPDHKSAWAAQRALGDYLRRHPCP